MPHKNKRRKVDKLDTVADRLEQILDDLQSVPTDISAIDFMHRRHDLMIREIVALILDLQQSAIESKRSRHR